ncbi:MAG: glycogen synthase GlgA, partial [Pseudomonadota bacterium]
MHALSVASEVYPLIKTGGLADVAGALPGALAEHGVAVRTLLPAYPVVRAHVPEPVALAELTLLGQPVRLLGGTASGLDVILVDAPALFDRPGGPYAGADGDHPDNWLRFAVLCRAALAITEGAIEGYRPDLVHAHDWQGALAPVYLRYAGRPVPSVLTIHNIAFQGQFGADIFGRLDLPPEAMAVDGIEYYGDVSTLKGGLQAADAITTVSPTYAREILDPQFGMGLEGVISARRSALHGIVNGIDTVAWDPTDDTALVKGYSSRALKGRRANKVAVEEAFGLAPGDGPILTVVSRLTWQKGMDVLAEAVDGLVARGARLALLGTGDPGLEAAFRGAAERHRGRVGAIIGYDERLAHLVQGGAD